MLLVIAGSFVFDICDLTTVYIVIVCS